MTSARRDFEAAVSAALLQLGLRGELDEEGDLQLRTGEDEVWIRLEAASSHKPFLRHLASVDFVLVVRSRIHTFRRAPRPQILQAIVARSAEEGVEVEYLETPRSLYAVERFASPPSKDELLESFVKLSTLASRWLSDVLPQLPKTSAR